MCINEKEMVELANECYEFYNIQGKRIIFNSVFGLVDGLYTAIEKGKCFILRVKKVVNPNTKFNPNFMLEISESKKALKDLYSFNGSIDGNFDDLFGRVEGYCTKLFLFNKNYLLFDKDEIYMSSYSRKIGEYSFDEDFEMLNDVKIKINSVKQEYDSVYDELVRLINISRSMSDLKVKTDIERKKIKKEDIKDQNDRS